MYLIINPVANYWEWRVGKSKVFWLRPGQRRMNVEQKMTRTRAAKPLSLEGSALTPSRPL
jgi:hypothetical protein